MYIYINYKSMDLYTYLIYLSHLNTLIYFKMFILAIVLVGIQYTYTIPVVI